MKKQNTIIYLCVFAPVFLCGLFFWPTIYRYEKSGSGILQINRFTGKAYYLEGTRKRAVSGPAPSISRRESKELPYSELEKITGRGGLETYGYFKANIYNGSSWVVTEVTFRLTIGSKEGKNLQEPNVLAWGRWLYEHPPQSRDYVASSGFLSPLSTDEFVIAATDLNYEYGLSSWQIISAKGYKEK